LLDFWPLFFLLAFTEAAVALYALLHIPSEGGGISVMRWVLLFPLLVTIVLSAIAVYFSRKGLNFRARWLEPNHRPRLYNFLTLFFPILAVFTSMGAFVLRWWDPDRLLPFFERSWPLLGFVIIISLQTTLWLLLLRFGLHKAEFSALKPALVAFAILIMVFGFVSLTKLGLTPDPAYWGEPGVPIQGWQLGLTLILAASFLPLSLSPFFKSDSRRTDFIIGAIIWALAASVWLGVSNEVLKNSFYFPIDPPANMPLPHSDSAYYDHMAHSLLIGTDYTGEIPTRPLYILFLTGLHLFFGENYNLIIYAQTLVLASLPVVFYTLGRKLHSRLAGVIIALLVISRELTSLLISSDTRVSNTKMLLVDNSTLLLILLACLFTFRWLERKDRLSAFIAGGIFGVLLLLRTQAMLILPLIILVAFLALRSEKRPWLIPVLLFGVGVVVSVAPWLTHNYLRIGKFAFDAPFQLQVLASQYAYTGNLDFNAVNLENKSLSQILITFALNDPGFVAGFISNHFLATEVGALLALPLMAPFNGLRAPINLYWTSFNGTLELNNILLLIVYLAVIAIGLGAAWKRWRWIGLLPLSFNLGYAAANGIGRFSGWRYDLPADWVAYFYFGVGFAQILLWFAKIFGFHQLDFPDWSARQADNPEKMDALGFKQSTTRSLVTLTLLFALFGALPWIAESVNPPPRYSDFEAISLRSQIAAQQNSIPMDEIDAFINQPNAIALSGRLLYPRIFGPNDGLTSTNPWPAYDLRDYPRLGFRLLNQDLRDIVFPNKGVPIENVQGYDVIVLGCERETYVEARLLVFPNADLSYLSDLGLGSCSF